MKMVDSLLNYPEFAMYVFAQMSEEEIENFFEDRNPMKIPPVDPPYQKIIDIRVSNTSDVPISFKLMDKVNIYTSVISEHYVGPGAFFAYTALPHEQKILNGVPEVICKFDNKDKKSEWMIGVEEYRGPLMRRGVYTSNAPTTLIPMVGSNDEGWILP